MSIYFMKEVTELDGAWAGRVPQHTYIFNGSALIGYIKEGTSEKIIFKNPSKKFDKRGRKFLKVKEGDL